LAAASPAGWPPPQHGAAARLRRAAAPQNTTDSHSEILGTELVCEEKMTAPALRAGAASQRKFIMGNGTIAFAGEGYEGRALSGLARGTSLGGGWVAHIRRSELPKYEGPSRISRVG